VTVSLNGSILGVHRDPERLVRGYRAARRAGGIGGFVSIYRQADAVSIASDGGRVCRPLIICENGAPKVTAEHTAKVMACFPMYLTSARFHLAFSSFLS
jgi:DNA-directed RNA polymerase III subunit RPC2